MWIDSLCIVQDDKEDWEKESTTMARIYRNACFTLCALVDSCDDGFLHREPSARIPFRSFVNDSIHGMYSFRETWQRWVPGTYYGLEIDFLESDLIVAKWTTRGWTLQEELFSFRLLQCSKKNDLLQLQRKILLGGRILSRWKLARRFSYDLGTVPTRLFSLVFYNSRILPQALNVRGRPVTSSFCSGCSV